MAEKEENRLLVRVGPAAPGFYKEVETEARRERKEEARREKKEAEARREWKEAEARREWKKKAKREAKKAKLEARARAREAMKISDSNVGIVSREEKSRHLLEPAPGSYSTVREENSRHLLDPAPGHSVPADEEAKAWRAAPRRACNWLRLLFTPRSVPLSAEELDAQVAALDEQMVFSCSVSRSELRAINHNIVLQCLDWYNSKHPGNEYEPAPGVVTRRSEFNNSLLWTHGNFVARRKRSGYLSFMPAPRTLFFFELLSIYDHYDVNVVEDIITCTPLDEPVTEAYNFLGFRLGWDTRRDGGCDCVCKTCYRQFHVPHIDLKRTCACGDSKVEPLCEMCYLICDVLHPSGGGFAFGHNQESFAYSAEQ